MELQELIDQDLPEGLPVIVHLGDQDLEGDYLGTDQETVSLLTEDGEEEILSLGEILFIEPQ